jgi:hypothetical protein
MPRGHVSLAGQRRTRALEEISSVNGPPAVAVTTALGSPAMSPPPANQRRLASRVDHLPRRQATVSRGYKGLRRRPPALPGPARHARCVFAPVVDKAEERDIEGRCHLPAASGAPQRSRGPVQSRTARRTAMTLSTSRADVTVCPAGGIHSTGSVLMSARHVLLSAPCIRSPHVVILRRCRGDGRAPTVPMESVTACPMPCRETRLAESEGRSLHVRNQQRRACGRRATLRTVWCLPRQRRFRGLSARGWA